MSHRRVHSQGSEIPFSWEDKPGVSKVTSGQEYPTDKGSPALHVLPQHLADSPPKPKALDNHGMVMKMKIPLPPCPISKQQAHPSRSTSGKGLRWQLAETEDPFLLAYKECTKSTSTLNININNKNNNASSTGKLFVNENNKKGSGLIRYKARKSRFNISMFSCKSSSDIRDDNFVTMSHFPPLPRDRSRSAR